MSFASASREIVNIKRVCLSAAVTFFGAKITKTRRIGHLAAVAAKMNLNRLQASATLQLARRPAKLYKAGDRQRPRIALAAKKDLPSLVQPIT